MLATLQAMSADTVALFMAAALILYLTPVADMMFPLASGAAGGLVSDATGGIFAGLLAARLDKLSAIIFGGLAARLALG